MSDSSSRVPDTRRRADLFVVPFEPITEHTELIEWPKDEAEAAAIVAKGKRIVAQLRLLEETVPDHKRWRGASVKVLMAVRYYLETHAEAVRTVNGRTVYSDSFQRFVVALAAPGKPGDGMPLAEFAFAALVPQTIVEGWLDSQVDS